MPNASTEIEPPFTAALTFDIHGSDDPADIDACADELDRRHLNATFFLPTRLIALSGFAPALRRLAARGHELGTHGHEHDESEIDALRFGGGSALAFLRESTDRFSDFFGTRPRAFRAPCWCRVCDVAIDELLRLGYCVDSSATPQRLGMLSSYPFENPYLFSARSPYLLRVGLLEIPTTSFLVPFGAPTIETLRELALALTALFKLEAKLVRSRVVVLQLHVGDLVASGQATAACPRKWMDLLPQPHGGIRARCWIRTRDRAVIARVAHGVISLLSTGRAITLREVHDDHFAGASASAAREASNRRSQRSAAKR